MMPGETAWRVGDVSIDGDPGRVGSGLDRARGGHDRPASPPVLVEEAGADAARASGDDGDLAVLFAHDRPVVSCW
jgi:hypothetical protein